MSVSVCLCLYILVFSARGDWLIVCVTQNYVTLTAALCVNQLFSFTECAREKAAGNTNLVCKSDGDYM